jgi:ubiquinone/menaquinone biosynthesis C-methylase UbiE
VLAVVGEMYRLLAPGGTMNGFEVRLGWIRNFAIRNFATKINFVFRDISQTNIAKFREKIAQTFAKHCQFLVGYIRVTLQMKSDNFAK